MTPVYIAGEGALLGLAASGHCLGMCLPALLPVLGLAGQARQGPWRSTVAFALGRLGGYVLVVALAALAGSYAGDGPLSRRAAGAAMLALAVGMGLWAAHTSLPESRLCAWGHRVGLPARAPWLFGLLVGVSPCPPLLLACASLFAMHALGQAALFAAGFVLSTSAVLVLAGCVAAVPWVSRRLSGVASAAAGVACLWFLARGLALLH